MTVKYMCMASDLQKHNFNENKHFSTFCEMPYLPKRDGNRGDMVLLRAH